MDRIDGLKTACDRSMSPNITRTELWGTVSPLTDEKIEQVGTVPWDGFPAPLIVRQDGNDLRRDGDDFLHVDYVVSALENRVSCRLVAPVVARSDAGGGSRCVIWLK